jgi:hypothetical protein
MNRMVYMMGLLTFEQCAVDCRLVVLWTNCRRHILKACLTQKKSYLWRGQSLGRILDMILSFTLRNRPYSSS